MKIRFGWLRFMYVYTIAGAGAFGLGIVIVPNTVRSVLGWPAQDPIMLGVTGSVYTAFAILSLIGLRSPLKFAPVLMLQMCYKLVWLLGVIVPQLAAGRLPNHAIPLAVIFASYIIGDLIAIPWACVLAKEPRN